jgi:hypothetical protein
MRRLTIGIFIVVIVVVMAGAGIVGFVLWQMISTGLSDRLAAESLVAASASLLIALLAGIIAIIAFAQSTRKPLLKLRTRVNADYYDPPGNLVPDEEQLSRGRRDVKFRFDRFRWGAQPGPALWIELHNVRNIAATHPAVRVDLVGFVITANLGADQHGWRSVTPRDGGVFAWLWNGNEKTVQGPAWSESLPALKLIGSSPNGSATGSCSIKISAVADGADAASQGISFSDN